MARLKETPAACAAKDREAFLKALEKHRVECIRLVEMHEHRTPDTFWRVGDPAGRPPRSDKDKARMRLVATVVYKNDKPVFPPAYTRLSDELIYLATKFPRASTCSKEYPYDFLDNGDIRRDRVPSGVGPIVWAHGLPSFPVYKGYYILCGRKHAKWIGWLLNAPDAHTKRKYPVWTDCLVVAPASALGLPHAIERQLRVHIPRFTRDYETGSEKNSAARDVVQKAHCDLSIVPRNSSGGYCLIPLCQVPGYQIRVGPDWPNGRLAEMISQETFSPCGLEAFDYSEALKKTYVNERCPQAERDGLRASNEEANGEESTSKSSIEDDEAKSLSVYTDCADTAGSDHKYDGDYEDYGTLEDEDVTDDTYDMESCSTDNAMGGRSGTAKKPLKTTKTAIKPTKAANAKAGSSKTVPKTFKVTKRVATAKRADKSTAGAKNTAEATARIGNLMSRTDPKVVQTDKGIQTGPKQSTQQPIVQNQNTTMDIDSIETTKKMSDDEISKKALCLIDTATNAIKNDNPDAIKPERSLGDGCRAV